MSKRLTALACTALLAMAAPALAQTAAAPAAPPVASPPKQGAAKPVHIGPPIQLHVAAKSVRPQPAEQPVLQADAGPEVYQGVVQ